MIYKDYSDMDSFKTKLIELRKEFNETGCPYTKDRNESNVSSTVMPDTTRYCCNCSLNNKANFYNQDDKETEISICQLLDTLSI